MSKDYPVITKNSDQNATDVPTDTTEFGGLLSPADIDVQTALETLDAVDEIIDEVREDARVYTDRGPTGELLAIYDPVSGTHIVGVALCNLVGENNEKIRPE